MTFRRCCTLVLLVLSLLAASGAFGAVPIQPPNAGQTSPAIQPPPVIRPKPPVKLTPIPEITTSNASMLQLMWTKRITDPDNVALTPIQIDASSDTYQVLVAMIQKAPNGVTSGKLKAVDAGSGDVLWTVGTTSSRFGLPRVGGNFVYVSPRMNIMTAYDLSTGTQHAEKPTPGAGVSAVGVFGQHVFGGWDNCMWVMDGPSGLMRWSAVDKGTPALPSFAHNTLYAGTSRGIYALDPANGSIKWKDNSSMSSATSAVEKDNRVFWASGGNLYAFDGKSGALLWKSPITSGTYQRCPVAVGSRVMVCTPDSKIRAFGHGKGDASWTTNLPGVNAQWPLPVVNDVLFAPTAKACALNASTGAVLWSYNPNSGSTSSPQRPPFSSLIVVNNRILIGVGGDFLYAFCVK